MLVRWGVAGCSNVPSQPGRKNRAGRAIRDRSRPHAPEAPPIPMQPVATRNRRAVPGRIASPPALRPDVPGQLAATRKENDRNRESRPAEFPRAAGRSSVHEFARAVCDRTILVQWTRRPRRVEQQRPATRASPLQLRADETYRATQNLPLRARAAPRQFPIVAKPVYLRGLGP